jgi:hypothetical protein
MQSLGKAGLIEVERICGYWVKLWPAQLFRKCRVRYLAAHVAQSLSLFLLFLFVCLIFVVFFCGYSLPAENADVVGPYWQKKWLTELKFPASDLLIMKICTIMHVREKKTRACAYVCVWEWVCLTQLDYLCIKFQFCFCCTASTVTFYLHFNLDSHIVYFFISCALLV